MEFLEIPEVKNSLDHSCRIMNSPYSRIKSKWMIDQTHNLTLVYILPGQRFA